MNIDKFDSEKNEMSSIESLLDQFEQAGHEAPNGDKIWFARDLQTLLGYQKWDKFEQVIERAKIACATAGHPIENHFQEVFPQAGKNPKGGRPSKDFQLDRYASYLIAQNASSSLRQVAFAQTYFAIQTRRQELADQDGVDFDTLSENQKRLYLRNQVVAENKRLASAAKAAGVQTGQETAQDANQLSK